jgi:hypothetical protein
MSNHSPRRSLRLYRISPGETIETKPGTAVFQIPELLTEVINHCSWASCVNLSHTTVGGRIVVQASIRRRIHNILNPFVDDLSAFFVLIQEIKGAVVGSAAWNVMTIDNVGPQDINIVVPNGSVHGLERLKALLSCSGSTVVFDGSPGIVYANCAMRYVKIIRDSVSFVTYLQYNPKQLILFFGPFVVT